MYVTAKQHIAGGMIINNYLIKINIVIGNIVLLDLYSEIQLLSTMSGNVHFTFTDLFI